MSANKTLHLVELGAMDYAQAWALQTRIFQRLIARKVANRQAENPEPIEHYLLFCEHPPVYTLGRSGKREHLLWSEEELENQGFSFYPINRGGDITYHGPGQLTGYPILDLDEIFTDVARYIRGLEEMIIRTIADYGLEGQRYEGLSGVWLDPHEPQKARKICAVGVHLSRWVSMHGFAFNISTDLSHFRGIVPCGIQDKAVTSLSAELGYTPPRQEVWDKVAQYFARVFNLELQSLSPDKLLAAFPEPQKQEG